MRGKAKVECDGRHWDGNVAAMEEAGQGSYYLQDDLGSPMHLLDGCGEIRESYGFDEFVQFLFPELQGRMGGVLSEKTFKAFWGHFHSVICCCDQCI